MSAEKMFNLKYHDDYHTKMSKGVRPKAPPQSSKILENLLCWLDREPHSIHRAKRRGKFLGFVRLQKEYIILLTSPHPNFRPIELQPIEL